MPALAFTVVFFVVPLLFVLGVSPMQWDGISAFQFAGLRNYIALMEDSAFSTAFTNTLLWIAVGLFVHLPLALLVALLLSKRPAGWRVFRTALFVPSIISTTALALLWYFIFNPDFGLVSALLALIPLEGLQGLRLLADPTTALWATQLPYVIYLGFPMMVFLTQISAIPEEYFEAARIDGAHDWQMDLHVTIPLVKPAIIVNSLFVVTYNLRLFEYPFIMTDGGPANASINLSLYIYKTMLQSFDYGGAMAASAATIAAGLVIVGLMFTVARRLPGDTR